MNHKQNTRASAANFFIGQLDSWLYRDAAKLKKLDERGCIPPSLHAVTRELFGQAIKTVDQFRVNPESITKADEENVNTLRATLSTFDTRMLSVTCPARSLKALKSTADDIRHFCHNFNLTLHSFTPGARLPNPPTNHAAQAVWLRQIAALGSSRKIPGWKTLNPLVKKATGDDLKERTHRDWLGQLSKGTFFCLIQKRQ
jgi:hypothetical protein